EPGQDDAAAAILDRDCGRLDRRRDAADYSVLDQQVGRLSPHGPDIGKQKRAFHWHDLHQRSFGFSASRSQSPRILTDNTSRDSWIAGNTTIHHRPENRYSLPMRISVPSDGSVGGMPTPRKLSVASIRIASPKFSVAATSTGVSVFGRMWRRMMRVGVTRISRAAWTYSLPRSTMARARTVRAYCTQAESEMAMMRMTA